VIKHQIIIDIKTAMTILIAGIFQAIGLLLFYRSMRSENISLASPIFATTSTLTIIYGVFILRENISPLRIITLIIIILGVILASLNLNSSKNLFNKGLLTALAGAGVFGIGFLLFTLVLKNGEYYFCNILYALSTFIVSAILFKNDLKNSFKIIKNKKSILLLPLSVGLLYSVGNNLYGTGLKVISSYIGAAIFNAYPIITVLLGFLILKEKLKTNQFIGVTIVIIGLIFSSF